MSLKCAVIVLTVVAALNFNCEGRQISHGLNPENRNGGAFVIADSHLDLKRSLSHKQARVFPGAVAIKKLVLLKFKKIVPISLILLKSGNENEAELVPVYPTSEIPSDVQFIPTPNGISGHKDVQAIAIPSSIHEQLQANGLDSLEKIEALINKAEDDKKIEVDTIEDIDEPLNPKEDDEDQILDPKLSSDHKNNVSPTNLRRLAVDDINRTSSLRKTHHTTVEEIPLFLYSAKDTPQYVYRGRSSG
ncbi:uncharacterized protein LOC119667228 [Teleopsis dalmanni]|uniref:uncharacterized protein LOC119667228 n=1 Tax=Teleopsis dalmanni TaxID=139649 RepID=UPI0018CCF9BF|nr:uncharacterized protein LOC119667228 [Teleopsis dalmanni]